MAYVDVVLIFLLVNLALDTAFADDVDTRKLIREYDKRVCENRPSCDLTSSVQKDRLTLKKRDCMCDFECSKYDDCCMDSQYFNALSSSDNDQKKYICAPYSEVYMVVSCSADYQNKLVIANCEKAIQPLEENNFDLVIPVTNTKERITYANKYCALCNNEEKYESWDFYAGCGELPTGFSPETSATTFTQAPPKPVQTNIPFTTTKKPSQTQGKKYESSKKANVIPDSKNFTGGCQVEDSPCNVQPSTTSGYVYSHEKPESKFTSNVVPPVTQVTQIPQYIMGSNEFHTVDDSKSTAIKIRVEIQRFRRQSDRMKIDYTKYQNQVDKLIEKARYDPNLKKFVVNSNEDKTLVCRFNSTYSKAMEDSVRKCVPNLVSECRNSKSPCPSYTSIVYDSKTRIPYRNRECASCNGIRDNLTGCPSEMRQAASKDLVKTNKKSQDQNLEKFADSDIDAIGFA